MERGKNYNEDIINYEVSKDTVYLMLFKVDKGTIINKEEYVFEYYKDFLEDFLTQYYSENKIPKQIILPKKVEETIKKYLEKIRKSKVEIINPKIGEKKALLNLIKKNIEINFLKEQKELKDLKQKLNLQETPNIIECFDVSHLGGKNLTGSMVQFRNGKPDKTNYRRFKIKTFTGNNDTLALREVVRRRYYRLKKQKEKMPNLILIDGGKPQLSAGLKELEKLNLKIPIISLAKKFEEIYLPLTKQPIKLNKNSKARRLLQKIRDEAHRFAIKYNKLLRQKEQLGKWQKNSN